MHTDYEHSDDENEKGPTTDNTPTPNTNTDTHLSSFAISSHIKNLPPGNQRTAKISDLSSALKEQAEIEAAKNADAGLSNRIKQSGLGLFLRDDLESVHHEDFDGGVNAMALLCALMLSIPFEIVGNLDYGNLTTMKEMFQSCNSDELDFEGVYRTYRGSFLATVYWSIAGMILATFYFLFKRTGEDDYKEWRWKARWLVISLFFSTAFAICSLILLTNMYFNYYLLAGPEFTSNGTPIYHHNICNNGTYQYIVPGLSLSVMAFIWGLYLIM